MDNIILESDTIQNDQVRQKQPLSRSATVSTHPHPQLDFQNNFNRDKSVLAFNLFENMYTEFLLIYEIR